MKKSLADISWNVSEEIYRADPAFSYSTLARFNREGFEGLQHLEDKVESPSLLFGSLVDTLLTDGEEAFNEKFLVAAFPHLPDSQEAIAKIIFNTYEGKPLGKITDAEILDICTENNFQMNWKPETRVKVIRQNCQIYYDLLRLSASKTLVDSATAEDARTCVEILKNNEATSWYFAENNPFDDIERLYQLKFLGDYEGIPIRCMADLLIVDHKNKTIIPCDLKTSYKPEYRFYRSFIEWNYWIQAQLYWYIIRQNLDDDPYFKDFKLLNYRFIVICNKTRTPLVWEYPDTQVLTSITLNTPKGEIELKNWRTLVKELNYYRQDTPEFPKYILKTEPNNINTWIQYNL